MTDAGPPLLDDPTPHRGPIPVRPPRSRARAFVSATQRAQVRTGRFGLNATLHRRARRFARHDLAAPAWNPIRTAHAALDELVMVYFEVLSDPMPAPEFLRVEQEVDQLIELWSRLGVADDPASLHAAPPAPKLVFDEPSDVAGRPGRTIRFESGWTPHADAPGREAWTESAANEIVTARVLSHPDGAPRPWLVIVHGADMGRTWDARMLRAVDLHERLGANVILPVLPMHGPRGDGSHARASFPSDDHVANIHGLTHSLWDVRRTIAWVREQSPTAIGVFGFSLGGCISSLTACVEDDLDAVVMGCPAADMVELIRSNTRQEIREQPRMARLIAQASRAAAPVTAFAMEPRIGVDRLTLLSAQADRLADPVFQVGRLWHHFGKPELVPIDSGHVSYFMQRRWVDHVVHSLARRGVVTDDRAEGLALAAESAQRQVS